MGFSDELWVFQNQPWRLTEFSLHPIYTRKTKTFSTLSLREEKFFPTCFPKQARWSHSGSSKMQLARAVSFAHLWVSSMGDLSEKLCRAPAITHMQQRCWQTHQASMEFLMVCGVVCTFWGFLHASYGLLLLYMYWTLIRWKTEARSDAEVANWYHSSA